MQSGKFSGIITSMSEKKSKFEKEILGSITAGHSYEDILNEAGIQIVGVKREFAKQLVASGYNATEAARKVKMRAKDPKAAGNRLKNDPDVIKAVEAIEKYSNNLAALTRVEIIENLRETYKRAMEEGDFKEANKASELLGQSLGMFGKGNVGMNQENKAGSISKKQTTEGKLKDLAKQLIEAQREA